MGAFEKTLIVALGCCAAGILLAMIGVMNSVEHRSRRNWKNQAFLVSGASLLIVGVMELWWILF